MARPGRRKQIEDRQFKETFQGKGVKVLMPARIDLIFLP
jgi:hypothetical protein